MDHNYFKDKISAYHDAGLNLEEQELLRQHIASCDECAAALAELEAFDQMVEKRSSFGADDYFEQNAQKIEAALGFGTAERVVDITPKKPSGLWWKLTAVAASIAVLSFIALHEEEILEPVERPQESLRDIQEEGLPEQSIDRSDRDRVAGQSAVTDERQAEPPDITPQVLEKPAGRTPQPSALTEQSITKSVEQAPAVDKASNEPDNAVKPPAARIVAEPQSAAEADVAGFDSESLPESAESAGKANTVISGNRGPEPDRLAFWQKRLDELTAATTGKQRSTTSGLTKELSPRAETQSLTKKKTKAAGGSSDSTAVDSLPVSSDLLLAHYMIASLTTDSTQYSESFGFISRVAKSTSDQAKYARDLIDRLTGAAE